MGEGDDGGLLRKEKRDAMGEGEGRKERVEESSACGGSWERNADTETPHEGSL